MTAGIKARLAKVACLHAHLGSSGGTMGTSGRSIRMQQVPAKPLRLLDTESGELLVELGDLPAGVQNTLHAGPRRVGLRVNVQAQRVARLAHAGTGLELRSVGHDDGDLVVIGMDAGLHGMLPCWRNRYRPATRTAAYSGRARLPQAFFDQLYDGPPRAERLSGPPDRQTPQHHHRPSH